MPASGKSTIAKILIKKIQDVELIVSDDISSPTYSKIMNIIDEITGMFKYIIIDATFYNKKWREELREVIDERDKVYLIYVQCSLETCIKRNKEREDSIPEKAIHIIWNKFDIPENPDIIINTDIIDPEEAVEIILSEIHER